MLPNGYRMIEILPLKAPPRVTVTVPGSKSVTNRALIAAALANGVSRLSGVLFSDDTRFMLQSLRGLGWTLEIDESQETVTIWGESGRVPGERADLFVGNSGTSIRFLTALSALGHGEYRLDGVPRMQLRPIEPLLDALRQLGVDAISERGTGCPPVRVRSSGLLGGMATMPGELSSQYFSALLLVGPATEKGICLQVEGDLVSRPYVELTAHLMRDLGAEVRIDGFQQLVVRGGHGYSGRDYRIEPDASSASYFFAAAALTGGQVRVSDLGSSSMQGDYRFLEVLERMGCQVERGETTTSVRGPQQLRGVEEEMRDISDTAQTLAALAPFADGPTTIRNIANARVKETDRIAAMATELRKLGQEVDEYADGLRITPRPIQAAEISTYEDHRMAMAFALIGLKAAGIRIQDPGCVAKTFPDYFRTLGRLYHPSEVD